MPAWPMDGAQYLDGFACHLFAYAVSWQDCDLHLLFLEIKHWMDGLGGPLWVSGAVALFERGDLIGLLQCVVDFIQSFDQAFLREGVNVESMDCAI
jgi:hypothetical protein